MLFERCCSTPSHGGNFDPKQLLKWRMYEIQVSNVQAYGPEAGLSLDEITIAAVNNPSYDLSGHILFEKPEVCAPGG